jgi:argininosuccinate synthase
MSRTFWALVAATAAAGAVLALWPGLDLAAARFFYDHGGFIGRDGPARLARDFFRVTPFVVLAGFVLPYLQARWGEQAARWLTGGFARLGAPAAAVGGALAAAIRRFGAHLRWAPDGRSVAFLIVTIAVGSGLIVNLGLKDHTHRPRPVHVVEFGGKDEFRPWYRFDGACRKNCSFVSGEAASGFWMVAPAMLAPPPWRAPAVAGALVFGAAASLLRMAFGGHFLSDVLFGAAISLLVILAAWRLIWPRGRPSGVARAPWPSIRAADAVWARARALLSPAWLGLSRSSGRLWSERAARLASSKSWAGLKSEAAAQLDPSRLRTRLWRARIALGVGVLKLARLLLGEVPMSGLKTPVKRVVLAYSGGLDTSIILKWLQTAYGCEVVAFTADLGQGEELEPARRKAEMLGVKPEHIFVEDLREEFVRDYVFPMFRANAQYEGQYLLGTSIARPLIAKRLVEIARQVGADAIAHGATGKGNDQVRFELSAYALEPDIRIIAPWREWDFGSRSALIAFAEEHQIPIAKDKRGEAPFSTDANLLHTSSEGKVLEDPAVETPSYVYSRTVDPEQAPDRATVVEIAFEKGDAVAVDGERLTPAALLARLNQLGRDNGIGRLDLVENRFVGMKSRGMYETPGGAILLAAHRAIESITLDRGAAHLKDELAPRYAELIYNGFWFSPERELLQALIDKSQEFVAGRARLKLYKGGVQVIGRDSPNSLYDQELVTFEEGAVAYDQNDASGFIKLNALRLRTLAKRKRRAEKKA